MSESDIISHEDHQATYIGAARSNSEKPTFIIENLEDNDIGAI